jgi:hypothetical protein
MLEGLEPAKSRVFYCKVDLMSKELEEKDYKILLQAIADTDTWTARGLQNALKLRGVTLADTTIAKHRNKTCNCYKD